MFILGNKIDNKIICYLLKVNKERNVFIFFYNLSRVVLYILLDSF